MLAGIIKLGDGQGKIGYLGVLEQSNRLEVVVVNCTGFVGLIIKYVVCGNLTDEAVE